MTTLTLIDEKEETRRGELIAKILNLKHTRDYPDRYNTEWGTKTALGLFRVMQRIVLRRRIKQTNNKRNTPYEN